MHSLGADPLSKVEVDEKILVYVMQPEADQGQIMLSVDRARGERGWRVLQQRYEEGEAFEAEVTGSNKGGLRSEEHTSELQSLMRNSYAVYCLKKKTNNN